LENIAWPLLGLSIFKIIKFVLAEDVNFCSGSSLSIVYSSCDVLNVLDDKVNRNSVVSETWDDDVSINHGWENEIPE